MYKTGYGLTESTGGIIHQIDEEEEAYGSVGKLFAGVYVCPIPQPLAQPRPYYYRACRVEIYGC
jgi:hypothetical protein